MYSEKLQELKELSRRHPHEIGKPYAKELRQRILNLYNKEKIPLNVLSKQTGISHGLLYIWNERAKNNIKYTKKIKKHAEFRAVKVVEEKILNNVELVSPSGYVVRGLSSKEIIKVLKELHV